VKPLEAANHDLIYPQIILFDIALYPRPIIGATAILFTIAGYPVIDDVIDFIEVSQV
jgi:hypothetical protein